MLRTKGKTMTSELKPLLERLDRLERRNHQLTFMTLGIGLVLIVMFVSAFSSSKRTVDAERIVVHDNQGRARITLGTPASSGAAVGVGSDEPAIWISDANGIDRTIITTGSVRFADEHGRPVSPTPSVR